MGFGASYIRDFKVYIFSGTTWLGHITSILLGKENKENIRAAAPIVEFAYPAADGSPVWEPVVDKVKDTPSPRILSTHLFPGLFDQPLKTASPKVIVLMRNPKDCLVSYYHFYRANVALGKFQGPFEEFWGIYETDQICFGDPIKHVIAWWNQYKDDPRFTFIFFEDMKKDPVQAIKKIVDFLELDTTDEQIQEIAERTSFEKMSKDPRVNKQNDTKHDSTVSKYLRKGAIGDWQNMFTDEQSRQIDERCKKELEPLGIRFDFGA